MVRPLYRWKSFWLGLLVLVFLGCGWVRSMGHIDGFSWMPQRFIFTAWQTNGQVGLGVNHNPPPPASVARFRWSNEPGLAEEPWFPNAVEVEKYPSDFRFRIAHWFLILLFLVPWVGFLVWRSRRVKRLAGAIPAVQV